MKCEAAKQHKRVFEVMKDHQQGPRSLSGSAGSHQTDNNTQSVRGQLHNLAATCFNLLPAARANQHSRSLGANRGEPLDVAKPSFQTKHDPEKKRPFSLRR